MADGLILGIEEFRALPNKEKLDCLYENQTKTLRLVGGYKLHQKIQYPWLVFLTGVVIFIIKQLVSN